MTLTLTLNPYQTLVLQALVANAHHAGAPWAELVEGAGFESDELDLKVLDQATSELFVALGFDL